MLAVMVLGVFAPVLFKKSQAALMTEYESALLKKLNEVQAEIKKSKQDLKNTQGRAKTLSQQINTYNGQIKKAVLELEESELLLQESQLALDHISSEMAIIDERIEKQKIFLSSSIRIINDYRSNNFEMLLGTAKLSDFFNQVNSIELINKKISESLQSIVASKEEYRKIYAQVEDEKEVQLRLKDVQEYQKQSLDQKKAEKNTLLKQTKGQESAYQKMITEAEKKANEIRNQLFVLQNMGGSLKFEEAVKLAIYASAVSGIRPAFLLAILSRESNIGKNVGSGNWRVDMNLNQRDKFLAITKKLDLDPDKMPVSATPSYGWGGAMGPAQFIPSTWLAYEDQVAAITGHNPPNPWNITDAFVASSLFLRDLGAAAKTADAEWRAAMKYLAGGNWQKSSLRFYGDNVMEIAEKIQKDIDIITREN